MADDDFIHNPPTTPTSPATSGFDATSDMASEPQGQPALPFNAAKAGSQPAGTGANKEPSPLQVNAEVASNPFSPQGVSSQAIATQADTILNQFQRSQALLQDPALAQNQNLMKAATTDLLSQHLTRVNDNMAALGMKLGIPLQNSYTPPSSGTQAVAHFLDYLTGGQQDLINLTNSLQKNSGKMSPSDLLTVQLKMSGVQQQMEFFSVLLGKAVDNIKTIMSIQN